MPIQLNTTIDLSRPHKLPFAQAKIRAEAVAKVMAEQYGIAWSWEGNSVRFHGAGLSTGVRGALHLSEKNVRIVIHLPLLFGGFAGRIKAEVMTHLDTFSKLP